MTGRLESWLYKRMPWILPRETRQRILRDQLTVRLLDAGFGLSEQDTSTAMGLLLGKGTIEATVRGLSTQPEALEPPALFPWCENSLKARLHVLRYMAGRLKDVCEQEFRKELHR